MLISAIVDPKLQSLCFEEIPNEPICIRGAFFDSNERVFNFRVADKQTGKVVSVFAKESEFRRIGLSATVWNSLSAQQLPQMIHDTAVVRRQIERAAPIALKYLSRQHSEIFTTRATWFTRVVVSCIYAKHSHYSSCVENVPGIYFDRGGESMQIFINLKGTAALGAGGYGKVKKVLWLTSPNACSVIAKKVFFGNSSKNMRVELNALKRFAGKAGIISLIAGGCYAGKHTLFFPLYECNLISLLQDKLFSLTIDQALSMTEQWLEGLTNISKEGIHGDLSINNLLLRRAEEGKCEAVIADLGAFLAHGEGKHEKTTPRFRSPELCRESVFTSKLDVWGLGLSLLILFSPRVPSLWKSTSLTEFTELVSNLKPDWALEYLTSPRIPPFIRNIINRMLDPRHEHRPEAEEVLNLFRKGLEAREKEIQLAEALYAIAIGEFFH